ncbi:unnamed protein product [Ectocarpus sp. 12 AP-2014]
MTAASVGVSSGTVAGDWTCTVDPSKKERRAAKYFRSVMILWNGATCRNDSYSLYSMSKDARFLRSIQAGCTREEGMTLLCEMFTVALVAFTHVPYRNQESKKSVHRCNTPRISLFFFQQEPTHATKPSTTQSPTTQSPIPTSPLTGSNHRYFRSAPSKYDQRLY